jgi:hypothetical protein
VERRGEITKAAKELTALAEPHRVLGELRWRQPASLARKRELRPNFPPD